MISLAAKGTVKIAVVAAAYETSPENRGRWCSYTHNGTDPTIVAVAKELPEFKPYGRYYGHYHLLIAGSQTSEAAVKSFLGLKEQLGISGAPVQNKGLEEILRLGIKEVEAVLLELVTTGQVSKTQLIFTFPQQQPLPPYIISRN